MSTKSPDSPPLDPMLDREAAKYAFPVPSREAVLAHLAQRGEPMSLKRLAAELGVDGERDLDSFARRLRAMERDGQLLKNRRGRYGLIEKMDMVRGHVIGHPDGFGFLEPDEGGEDLFLSPREMRQVLHGDRVVARVAGLDARGRKEGSIVEVLERRHRSVVGRYRAENQVGFVAPADKRLGQDILIPQGGEGGARSGQIVVAEIVDQPTVRTQAVGKIVEVLGDHMAPGMEIEVATRMFDLPHVWPDALREETAQFGHQVPEDAKQGRVDIRELPLVTIDGEDARDFDDAVYCEPRGKDFRLLVAIADVSHYVRAGTALDREAYSRGNSVYFPNYVIPMLPEILSNGLCSLNPDVDRLCMVCDMHVNARGKILEYKFYNAVMRSHARLTYNAVAAMLVGKDAALRQRYAALVPHLEDLYTLYNLLHGARAKRGAVDFDLPETRIIYNEQRKIERIEPVTRNDAHRLIEECMLAANVCAAEWLTARKMAIPYRIHAGPTPEKLANLRDFLFEFGLKLGGGDEPQASDYAKLLASVEGRPDARLIQAVMLRSLSQAIYSPENIGHFALGYPSYTHFTSPIRRYPDLLVHRAINTGLRRAAPDSAESVQVHGEHLSMTERRADDATRDVTRRLKTEYMQGRIGEEFDGIISGVTNFGIFVELSEVYVDGLVHITALGNDYYHFDPAKHRLLGERTKTVYRLGDKVRIRVVRVDLDEAKLDFELAGSPAPAARAKSSRPAERGGGLHRTGRRRAKKKK
ncbi:MAG: ribonuclease R [Gammaproteobacteria bacterium]|nr:ribonuclease R [Gammaproteobacteria bacterium]